jgi:hypothetical protein
MIMKTYGLLYRWLPMVCHAYGNLRRSVPHRWLPLVCQDDGNLRRGAM